ncbi:MAG TPA: hypothetical protein VFB30_08065 [Spirochaetia bacterium]|nr:hypothetical protein [Spirochaetia bacterium]
MTPSRDCSPTVSKKNKGLHGHAAVLVLCISLLPAAKLAGQGVDLLVSSATNVLSADITFRWNRMEELVASLRQGLESRITFTARVYEKRRGILPFRGDRLLVERVVSHSAFWDFLDDRFVVETDTGTRVSFESVDALLKGFFGLSAVPLYTGPRSPRAALYVTARAQFEPVRLMPPLTLVGIVGRAATYTSPWARRDAP